MARSLPAQTGTSPCAATAKVSLKAGRVPATRKPTKRSEAATRAASVGLVAAPAHPPMTPTFRAVTSASSRSCGDISAAVGEASSCSAFARSKSRRGTTTVATASAASVESASAVRLRRRSTASASPREGDTSVRAMTVPSLARSEAVMRRPWR